MQASDRQAGPALLVPLGPPLQLFLISFLILFFELICIRLIPAYIRYLGFFTNFILLGCFLGMGLGCMCARHKADLLGWFAPGVLALVGVIHAWRFDMDMSNPDVLFFGTAETLRWVLPVEPFYVLPLVFGMVTALLVLLSQPLGRLLSSLPPLQAYSLNILGSLAGTLAFAGAAYASRGPLFWLGTFSVLLLLFMASYSRPRVTALAAGALTLALLLLAPLVQGTLWSPYYKIVVTPYTTPGPGGEPRPGGHNIDVNNIGHQFTIPVERLARSFYNVPYHVTDHLLPDVLIAGAGTGNDVALSLHYKARAVDAVEIDPVILELGRRLHPNHPYQDPRVTVHLGDARDFLQHTNRKYDLIVFALTDSLTLTSSFSSLRLESFLFTVDSLRLAREHLKPDGLFVMYNLYRERWLIVKLAEMIHAAFGARPWIYSLSNNLAVLVGGPGVDRLGLKRSTGPEYREGLATDDWPFLYLRRPSFPGVYLKAFAMVAAITLALLFAITPAGERRGFSPHFFFMGAAFFLLETKSIVQFSLLFGSTWLVNALVIAVILVMVLLAIAVVAWAPRLPVGWLFVALFLLLAAQYAVPVRALDVAGTLPRFLLAGGFLLLPVFLANVIFSHSLKGSQATHLDLASNLLGALAGGVCEYLAMLYGYSFLTLGVALFYALAFLALRFHRPVHAVPVTPSPIAGAGGADPT